MRRAAAALTFVAVLGRLGPASAEPKIARPDGTPVTIRSSHLDTTIFLAHGDVQAGESPDPFERVGVAPQTIRLQPGLYTLETSSPSTTLGHLRINVEGEPLTVEVHPGSYVVKAVGTVFEGLGVTAIVLGILTVVSFSRNDAGFQRWAIGLPLLLGGAGTFFGGLGLSIAGSTRIDLPNANAYGFGTSVLLKF